MVRLTVLASTLVLAGATVAQGQLMERPPERTVHEPPVEPLARVGGFLAIGPSLTDIRLDDDGASGGDIVGAQVGVVSISIELRVLFAERIGFAVTPLTWQPSGGLQESGDHWRFVRAGGGPRVQILPHGARAQLTLGYDLSYLRATDLETCPWFSPCDEPPRTFEAVGHSFSLRLDTPIVRSSARIGARIDGGFSSDTTMRWLTFGVSLGIGQRGAWAQAAN
ncbi:MAG: hypothetical protein AB8H86_19620 [Polyangiales bacterium]